MPRDTDLSEVYALIARVASPRYAAAFRLSLTEGDGFDSYEVSDGDGAIHIRATSGVAMAAGFHAYLRTRCGYTVGALTTSGHLPPVPPPVGEPITGKSEFLYRYFFNYCTFSYTYAFDTWEEWERTLDYLLLSGYNLILNPIGLEGVFRRTLLALGYTETETSAFLCGPAFYAWQWMMNMTGWAGGAPARWYDERLLLAGRINRRLHAFGVATVAPGYAGMVPPDFGTRFPDAEILPQGRWCGFSRPSLLLPTTPHFDRVADVFYRECRRIEGAEDCHYYSVDPFHEGGVTDGIDLYAFGRRVFAAMRRADPAAVWILQGWTTSPKPEMVKSIPDGCAIVANLSAHRSCTAGMYADAPFLFCTVFCYGGQYNFQGAAEAILEGPYRALEDPEINLIGMGYMPEGVNCNEIIYEILSHNAFSERTSLSAFVTYYLKTRYGYTSPALSEALYDLCHEVLDGKQTKSGESALCARPTLAVKSTSTWGKGANPYLDQGVLVRYLSAMLEEYDRLSDNPTYRKDLTEAARQAVSNLSWHFVDRIQKAYAAGDSEALSQNGGKLLSLFDLQTAIVATDGDMLLGRWLEKAKRHGRTPAERAYFEWNARVQITLWAGREGAAQLHDYAAREWQGLLEDFYRPRWEAFLSRLEISLLTGTPLPEIHHYDEELPFTYAKKQYPTEPFGDLRAAVSKALAVIRASAVSHRAEEREWESVEAAVAKTATL
ncbi:MAG: alpha-N-acetylglucosaminidase [Clostridia bacterium]|nr:alpha-N-acetylglucosaminidase [Clostridia bacterium]